MKKRGRGIACSWYGIGRTGTPDCASAMVEIDDGGTVKILTGVTEIGEGVTTALAQIAAEEIGVRLDDVVVGDNDTARVPEAAHAGASRQTYVIGNAVKIAAREAKRTLYREAGRLLGIPEERVRGRDRKLFPEEDPSRSIDIVEVLRSCRRQGILAVGSGYWTAPATPVDPETGQGSPWSTYVFAAHAAEVEVDTETGEVKVLKVVAAHDVGRAINPTLVEGQIEGGVVMGQGYGLMEEFVLSEGVTTTPGFAKYILPTTMDVPAIKSILVEDPEPQGPFGAKGLGEAVSIPTAPAILNAIHDAIGVRFTSLPVIPEKVLLALKKSAPAPKNQEVTKCG